MAKKQVIVEKRLRIPPDYQYKALISENYIHSNWYKNKLETLGFLLKLGKDKTVLDLGTGSGNFELYFAKSVKKIYGLDYNDEAVAFAKKLVKENGIKNVAFSEGNIKDLKRVKSLGKYDFIVMVDVIEHFTIEQAEKIIKSLKNYLKNNGKVCIVTPNFNSFWPVIELVMDKLNLAPEMGEKQHLLKFDRKSLSEMITKSGYKIEKLVTFNTFSFLLPIERLRKSINSWELRKIRNGNMLAIVASSRN